MNTKVKKSFVAGLLSATLVSGCAMQPQNVEPREVRPPDTSVRPEFGQAVAREIDPAGRFLEANRRWAGAVCRLRFPTSVSEAGLLQAFSDRNHHARPGSKDLYTKMLVTDESVLRPLMRDDVVPSGTEFLVRGWGPKERGGNRGAALYLRFIDAPVDARFIISEAKSMGILDVLSPEYFDEAEAFMRTEAFLCTFADEQLLSIPGVESTPSPVRSKAVLELNTVRLAPVEVVPGAETSIILEYEIVNSQPGSSVAVIEQRRLLKDGREIAVFDNTEQRTAGSFFSRQPLRVPANAAPGYYEVEGTAYISGSSSSATTSRAIFRVLEP